MQTFTGQWRSLVQSVELELFSRLVRGQAFVTYIQVSGDMKHLWRMAPVIWDLYEAPPFFSSI